MVDLISRINADIVIIDSLPLALASVEIANLRIILADFLRHCEIARTAKDVAMALLYLQAIDGFCHG
jgi:hypothetical protein